MLNKKWILFFSLFAVFTGWLYQMSAQSICFEKLGFIYLGNIGFWILMTRPIQNINHQIIPPSKWLMCNVGLSLFFVAFNQLAVNLFVQSAFLVCFNCTAEGTILDILQTNHLIPNLALYWAIVLAPRLNYLSREPDTRANRSIHLVIKQNGKFIKVHGNEIFWVAADNNAVNIHTETRKFVQYGRLKDFLEQLKYDDFVRVHRSYLVNARQIVDYRNKPSGDGILTLANGEQIKVSRNYKHNLSTTSHFELPDASRLTP